MGNNDKERTPNDDRADSMNDNNDAKKASDRNKAKQIKEKIQIIEK